MEAAGGQAVLTRADHASGSDRIFEALSKIDPDGRHDAVINLQGDLPTLAPEVVRAVLDPLSDPDVDIATPVVEIDDPAERHDPNVVKAAVAFEPAVPVNGDLEVHVAILGFGLKTEVRAGENHGRTLEHDFVVLGYRSLATSRQASVHTSRFSLPATKASSEREAVAAWISRPGDPRPIQAVGGWLN